MAERPRRRSGDRRFFRRRKVCAFCVDKVTNIDYQDVARLRRYLSTWAKIDPRRKTGTCAPHQRALSSAIKRARQSGLLPFTGSHSLMDLTRPEAPRGDRARFDRRERASRPWAQAATATAATGDGAAATEAHPSPAVATAEAPETPSAEATEETAVASGDSQPAATLEDGAPSS